MLSASATALALNNDEAFVGLLERRGHRPGRAPVVDLADRRAARVQQELDQKSDSTVTETSDYLLPGSWLNGSVPVESLVAEAPAARQAAVTLDSPPDVHLMRPTGDFGPHVVDGAVLPGTTFHGTEVVGQSPAAGSAGDGGSLILQREVRRMGVDAPRYRVHPRILGSVLAVLGVETAAVVAVVATDLMG